LEDYRTFLTALRQGVVRATVLGTTLAPVNGLPGPEANAWVVRPLTQSRNLLGSPVIQSGYGGYCKPTSYRDLLKPDEDGR
jgi:hypothetical protein